MIGGMTVPVHPERVIAFVTEASGITRDELCGPSRSRSIASWRHITQLLLRTLCWQSLEEIGQFLGGRHHTTVIYGIARGREMSATTPWDAVVLAAQKALVGEEGER